MPFLRPRVTPRIVSSPFSFQDSSGFASSADETSATDLGMRPPRCSVSRLSTMKMVHTW